jgi:hypothetical protein
MKKPTNPIAITTQPLAGQQLPKDWQRQAQATNTAYDQRRLEDLWKSPNWSGKLSADSVENLTRSSRLSS